MAEQLGDVVVLGEPVRRIEHGEGVVVRSDSLTVRASRVIVAMSPALAGRFIYEPALPALPRPTDPAHAQRFGDQVHGDLRRTLLARRGTLGPADE